MQRRSKMHCPFWSVSTTAVRDSVGQERHRTLFETTEVTRKYVTRPNKSRAEFNVQYPAHKLVFFCEGNVNSRLIYARVFFVLLAIAKMW